MMRLNPGYLLKTFLLLIFHLNHQDAVTGTTVRAVFEQVPTQSGLFAFQIGVLRDAAIGKSNKTPILCRFNGFSQNLFLQMVFYYSWSCLTKILSGTPDTYILTIIQQKLVYRSRTQSKILEIKLKGKNCQRIGWVSSLGFSGGRCLTHSKKFRLSFSYSRNRIRMTQNEHLNIVCQNLNSQ